MSLTVIILCAVIGLTSGAGVLPEDSVAAAEGGSFTFTTSLTTETPLHQIVWNFGPELLLTSVAGTTVVEKPYEGRITLFNSTGSLELGNLSLSDSGEYVVSIRPAAGDEAITGFTTLTVYERITNISVESSNPPVERDSVNLTCDASGSRPTREWMINGIELKPSDNIVFYEEKSVLSFRVLHRKDNGRYTCIISNPVSSESVDYTMEVNYGPDLVWARFPVAIEEGETLKVTCSAESVPTAKFSWTKDGTPLIQSHEYIKENVAVSDSGKYTCRATNDVTNRFLEVSHTVSVTEPKKPNDGPSLSTEAIVGITIASLVVVVGAAAGVFYIFKNKNDRKQKNKSLNMEHVYDNTSNKVNFNTDEENKHVYENTQNAYDRNM